MKLKEIVLAGAMLLSGAAFSQSQDKLTFDIYSKGEGFFSPRLNTGFLKIDSNKVYFSLLLGIYSTEFKKINDSTYQESAKNFWGLKEEVFDYSFKDSSYTLDNYFVTENKSREEKKVLERTIFDKKYKIPSEVFNYLRRGILKNNDSVHFIVFGMPYSVKIETTENDEEIIYSCNLKEAIKEEPGDFILFPYPLEVRAKKKDGKLIPLRFSTKFLNVKKGKSTSIEGELREK